MTKPYPPPIEARTLFIDGPVSVFIHQALEHEILEAFERLRRQVQVAARELNKHSVNLPEELS